ncbi:MULTISPECIES: FAD-dependent oxidoreductase [Alphaproteobacteria]|uniref:FAD-binding dehydrogenase n=2 Tax=Alphaproteobacteria TaxID=28211 RepID=A0A512HHF8_9HYPH|nr:MULTISPECIES: FAD-dependent oxidoreductase [Alphaproteobacteria]GEO84820.1 FAD-binding dehydrogenase [Ciceribacter naphthalenivorans]GLR20559.1 FAD-binding dehydrogenase [Ciceribacter naphthalenivorans]GLT03415.1 FAD-binding dehydrogenase [Sphingomonas psychrolutea]
MERQIVRTIACDVLVIGSGASGLAAAVTAAHHGLKVVVAEKAPVFGGTSAWSGGWLWIPRNPLARAAGIDEPPEAPMEYLLGELGNRARDPRLAVFLANGPDMVSFFQDHTAIRWIDGNRIPDFHETPGSGNGGRSVSVAPFDGRELGKWIEKLRPPLDVISLWGMGIASGADMGHFFRATRSPGSAIYAWRRLARHFRDLSLHRRGMQLVNGNALVARLMRSALDLKVTLLDTTPARQLLQDGDRVIGARLATSDGDVEVRTARGVVLATGGFPHDSERLDAIGRQAGGGKGHYSAAPRTNTGDGLRLGESAGAEVDNSLVSSIALAPISLVPQADGSFAHFPHLVERAKPGIVAVTAAGRRFVSEADSYHDFMKALIAATPAGEPVMAWLIADHRAQRRWGLGWSKPFPFPTGPAIRSGYLKCAGTLGELAQACGILGGALEETVGAFNRHAARGEDPEFHRGRSIYNRVQGDGDHRPNPSLAPLDKAPFYAVKIVPGSLGTFAGLKTDPEARVLCEAGRPIPGLFAVGNDMASVMGGNYPAGGITLGPGMTFGYIAGRVLAGQPVRGIDIKEKEKAE